MTNDPLNNLMREFYDIDGKPFESTEDWARAFEDTEKRILGRDTVNLPLRKREVLVSTVWLGIDHSWGNGPPLIFETMVFGYPEPLLPRISARIRRKRYYAPEWQWRYSTKEEALEGHLRVLEMVRKRKLHYDN